MPMPGIPSFSLRWTEPKGPIAKTEHNVEVNVVEHAGRVAPTGHVTATSAEQLGSLPAGGLISSTRFINDQASWNMANDLWKQVRGSAIDKWIPAATAPGGKLDRNDLELVITRGNAPREVYRTDTRHAAQPITDLIASASSVVGSLRLHPQR